MAEHPLDFLMTNQQAAEYLGCRPETISRYLAKGLLHKETRGFVTGIKFETLWKIKNAREQTPHSQWSQSYVW